MTIAVLLVTSFPALAAPPTDPTNDDPATVDAESRWFKGNLHTHSLWSDGNDYPEMIVDWYARHGYHFLALSDHNILSQGQKWMSVIGANTRAKEDGFARYRERFGDAWVETRTAGGDEQVRLKPLGEFRHLFERPGRFLLIQGEEITDRFEKKPIHMNASNVLELIKPQGGRSVAETMANNLAAVEEQGKRLGRPMEMDEMPLVIPGRDVGDDRKDEQILISGNQIGRVHHTSTGIARMADGRFRDILHHRQRPGDGRSDDDPRRLPGPAARLAR